ncbi:MAG: Phosphoglycerate mutase [Micavibrio sp.]|nr:Phosphoglycerate mutase [Micavibrio sp.]
MTILIIARHGNTFEAGETPRRVGAATDLPLTAAGRGHGRNIGAYLKKINLLPDEIYTSRLLRTRQTADEIIAEAQLQLQPQATVIFNELDYGPDENKTEDEVIARLGQPAITDWEDLGIVPRGWNPNADVISERWQTFAHDIVKSRPHGIVLVVTSNGIARFALGLPGDFETTSRQYGLKLATGALGMLEHDGKAWTVQNWNIRP